MLFLALFTDLICCQVMATWPDVKTNSKIGTLREQCCDLYDKVSFWRDQKYAKTMGAEEICPEGEF